MDVINEKVCLHRDCDGKIEQGKGNDFEGYEWVCEKCGSVFKSNVASNKKLKKYKIKDKLDFARYALINKPILAIFSFFILVKLIYNPFYDIGGFILILLIASLLILTYGFIDPIAKKDYFESRGVNWRE